MHTVNQVLQIIADHVAVMTATEELPTTRAGGRILGAQTTGGEAKGGLGRGVLMDSDSPPFDRAQLDGFAVRSADAVAGAELEIMGRQDAAPTIFPGTVGPGQCVAINTGGVFPQGADAVLMVEHTQVGPEHGVRAGTVRVLKPMRAGYGVQQRGSDARQGTEVLPVGARLGPAQIAAAVTAGARSLQVRRPIRVAVLTTGDELVAAGQPITGGQIRNSNHPMLLGLVAEALRENTDIIDLGTCPDIEEQLAAKLHHAITTADLTLVSGGMSMGSRDHVPAILQKLGVAFHVEKVRMKPGKPFVFGTIESAGQRRYVAGLPGNPVSALVTFHLFVREIMARLLGEEPGARWRRAIAATDFASGGEREFFHPCTLQQNHARELVAQPLPWRGSGDIFTVARSHALARRAINAPPLRAGESLDILPL